jgi:murein DD-endopeptidase MepM/ murein hydrolase activator NlpD
VTSSEQIGATATPTTSATGTSTVAPAAGGAQAQVKQLAQEFEAMLMTQMLRDMRRSMVSEESGSDGYGAEAMSDTTDVELGRALSQSGGFGLTSMLLQTIQRQAIPSGGQTPAELSIGPAAVPTGSAGSPSLNSTAPAPGLTTAPAPTRATTPPMSESSALALPPQGPVTSPFGWRKDPFTGATRFHSGVDIGLAYGTPVPAAAGGRVVFSGVNGGYGNTVVVEQPSGQQMRYAHLSAQTVQVGDEVESGQVIGRVGDTGRATGAHLHFEVLENGRAVDPAGLD